MRLVVAAPRARKELGRASATPLTAHMARRVVSRPALESCHRHVTFHRGRSESTRSPVMTSRDFSRSLPVWCLCSLSLDSIGEWRAGADAVMACRFYGHREHRTSGSGRQSLPSIRGSLWPACQALSKICRQNHAKTSQHKPRHHVAKPNDPRVLSGVAGTRLQGRHFPSLLPTLTKLARLSKRIAWNSNPRP